MTDLKLIGLSSHFHQFVRVAGIWYCAECNHVQHDTPKEHEIKVVQNEKA